MGTVAVFGKGFQVDGNYQPFAIFPVSSGYLKQNEVLSILCDLFVIG